MPKNRPSTARHVEGERVKIPTVISTYQYVFIEIRAAPGIWFLPTFPPVFVWSEKMIAVRDDRIDSLPWLHFEILEVRNDVRRETKSRERGGGGEGEGERENAGELQNVEDDWLFSLLVIGASEKRVI